jgi:hypothetical protein
VGRRLRLRAFGAADRIEAWCATGGDSVDGDGAGRKVEEHVRDERSTISWLLEPMMRRSGFEIVRATTRRGDFSKHVLRAA